MDVSLSEVIVFTGKACSTIPMTSKEVLKKKNQDASNFLAGGKDIAWCED